MARGEDTRELTPLYRKTGYPFRRSHEDFYKRYLHPLLFYLFPSLPLPFLSSRSLPLSPSPFNSAPHFSNIIKRYRLLAKSLKANDFKAFCVALIATLPADLKKELNIGVSKILYKAGPVCFSLSPLDTLPSSSAPSLCLSQNLAPKTRASAQC